MGRPGRSADLQSERGVRIEQKRVQSVTANYLQLLNKTTENGGTSDNAIQFGVVF